jgi:DNA gyrase/topoisomerase IV subunit A
MKKKNALYSIIAREDGTGDIQEIKQLPFFLFTISTKGFGKKTNLDEYRITARAQKGYPTFNITQKTGELVKGLIIADIFNIMVITKAGKTIVVPATQISECGRKTIGSKIINLSSGDEVQDIAIIPNEENDINQFELDGNEVMLITKNGLATRFNVEDVSSTGRQSSGVRGIKLEKDDCVISMVVVPRTKVYIPVEEVS